MSGSEINKVDLSLDEIIKINRKEKHHHERGRGGNNRIRGSSQSRGQGGGQRARRGGGLSPLNRKKTGMDMGGKGQTGGYRGQRGNVRGWTGNRGMRRGGSGSSRGGSMSRNTSSSQSSSLRGSRGSSRGGRGNLREKVHPAVELACQAGFELSDIQNKLAEVSKHRRSQLQLENRNSEFGKVVLDRRYDRERLICKSDDLLIMYDCKRQSMFDWFIRKDRGQQLTHFEEDTQNCVNGWPPANSKKYQPICDLLSINTAILAAAIRHILGTRGNLRGGMRGRGNVSNQGKMRGGGGQGQNHGHGQGQGQGQSHHNSSSSSNRLSLSQKRQMAIQALQQARKTIAQLDQQTRRQNYINARRGIGQQNPTLSNNKKNQGHYSSSTSLASTTSQLSSGSSRQLQGTQITAFNMDPVKPQHNSGGRRRWRPQSPAVNLTDSSSTLTISIDNNPSTLSAGFSAPQVNAATPRQRQRRRQWRRQNNSSSSSMESLDFNRGATPSFSHQLSKLKPTVSTQYIFQKKTFATGNTSFSLNDRFSDSASTDLMGRKVFM